MTQFIKITTLVQQLSYVYHKDGAITPYIYFNPVVVTPDHVVINKLNLCDFKYDPDLTLAPKDRIEIIVPNNDQQSMTLRVIDAVKGIRRKINEPVCPVCGEPLLPSTVGIGRCINRECAAQMPHTIYNFISALGLSMDRHVRKVILNLLTRGCLRSTAHLFHLPDSELVGMNVSWEEAKYFQEWLHGIRGKVSIETFLKALAVPDWDITDILRVSAIFAKQHWKLTDIDKIFDEQVQDKYTKVDWIPWDVYLGYASNRRVTLDLAKTLAE